MSEERNPYAAPQARAVAATPVPVDGETTLLAEPRRLPGGAGGDWIGDAWKLFTRAALVLVIVTILYFIIGFAFGLIPLLGDMAFMVTGPVWSAGLMLIAQKLARGGVPTVGDLFAGFSHPRVGRLLGIGALTLGLILLAVAAVALPLVLVLGTGFLTALDDPSTLSGIGFFWGLFAIVAAFVVALFFILAYVLYAPVLVTFHDVSVSEACRLSLQSVLRNWLSLTVYGLIVVGLAIASIFTLFLAWLVLWPLFTLAIYVSYRAMFTDPPTD